VFGIGLVLRVEFSLGRIKSRVNVMGRVRFRFMVRASIKG
jgi:hypothetical protein